MFSYLLQNVPTCHVIAQNVPCVHTCTKTESGTVLETYLKYRHIKLKFIYSNMDQDTVPNHVQTICMFFEKYNVKQDGITAPKLNVIYSAIMYALTDDVPRDLFIFHVFAYLQMYDVENPIYNDEEFMSDVHDVWEIYVELLNVFPFNVKQDGILEVVNLNKNNIKPHYWDALRDAVDIKNKNLKMFPLLFYQGMKSPVASFMDVIRNKRKAISTGTPGGSRSNKKMKSHVIVRIPKNFKRAETVPGTSEVSNEEDELREETVSPLIDMIVFNEKPYEADIVDMTPLRFFDDLRLIIN